MLALKKLDGLPAQQEYALRMETFQGLNMENEEYEIPFEECVDCYNLEFGGGLLKSMKGCGTPVWSNSGAAGGTLTLTDLSGSNVYQHLFPFASDTPGAQGYRNLYASLTNGKVFRFVANAQAGTVTPQEISFTSGFTGGEISYFTQFHSGGNNCAILGGPTCGPYVYTEGSTINPISGSIKPTMKRTVMHYNRLFGVGDPGNPLRIWFSAAGQPSNFTNSLEYGGYIDLSDELGGTIGVTSFFDSLLVFCKYGIASVYALSQQSDFSIQNIWYSGSEILSGSIKNCGQEIIFASRDGVYSYNGSSVSCISNKIKRFFTEQEVVSREECCVFWRGKYFLSLHSAIEGEDEENNTLLIFNTGTGSWQKCKGALLDGMSVCRDQNEEKLIVAYESAMELREWGTGQVFQDDVIMSCYWKSPVHDMGLGNARKRISEMHFAAKGDYVLIRLYADGVASQYYVTLTDTRKQYVIATEAQGCLIGFDISHVGKGSLEMTPLTFIYTAERNRP